MVHHSFTIAPPIVPEHHPSPMECHTSGRAQHATHGGQDEGRQGRVRLAAHAADAAGTDQPVGALDRRGKRDLRAYLW